MERISLRYQKVSDAKRFCEILNNPNFVFLSTRPTVKEEKKYLKKTSEKRKKNFEHNFAILYGKKVVGGAGFKMNQHHKHIGEIGYFVEEKYWGKGIATNAVKILEKIGFNKLKLKRIEIRMDPRNKASQKVAIKAGYKKEGLLKKSYNHSGELRDSYLYAKIRK